MMENKSQAALDEICSVCRWARKPILPQAAAQFHSEHQQISQHNIWINPNPKYNPLNTINKHNVCFIQCLQDVSWE